MMENYSLSTDFIQEHSKSCMSVCTCKLSQISVKIFYIMFTMKTNTWFCNTSGFNMRKNVKKLLGNFVSQLAVVSGEGEEVSSVHPGPL